MYTQVFLRIQFLALCSSQLFKKSRLSFKSLCSIHLFLRVGVTRAELRHCGKMPDTREELNRSVREGIIEFVILLIDWKGWDQGHMI